MELIIFLSIVLATNAFDPLKLALTTVGHGFKPANEVELLSTLTNVRTTLRCAILCYHNSPCRTFDFDSTLKQCRLFEGSVNTGSLLPNFSSTVTGWTNIQPPLFDLYNASGDQCVDNRFLDGTNPSGRCQCPIHTFWNGSMCLNQKFVNDTCQDSYWCRNDLWMSCASSKCTATAAPSSNNQTTSGGILYNVTDPTSFHYPTYTYYAYTRVATGSSATLSFFFRHDPGGWMLDDVSVSDGSTELITNGGFESGSLTGWNYSGTCNLYTGLAHSGSSSAKSGNYYYYDRCANSGDTISQTFSTVVNQTYTISFWLTSYYYYYLGTGTVIANITLF